MYSYPILLQTKIVSMLMALDTYVMGHVGFTPDNDLRITMLDGGQAS